MIPPRLTFALTLSLAVAAPGAARAEGLPGLPKAITLPQGDSPGQVTFNHDTHADAVKGGCVACHPSTFSILGRSHGQTNAGKGKAAPAAKPRPITHDRMKAGEACGKCHGKGRGSDIDIEDDSGCSNCHAGA